MDPAIKRTVALTALIILLAISVWIIVFFGNQYLSSQQSSKQNQSVNLEPANTESVDLKDLVIESRVDIGIKQGSLLSNPFALPATSTFAEDRAWTVSDAYGNVMVSGTIPGLLSSYSAMLDVYWFDNVPKTEHGELRILETHSSPAIIIPVKLPTETQTVEIYFRPLALSNCHSVTPVKRRITATQNDLDFYHAALRELLKGPSQEEFDSGLATMIPPQTRLLRVGKNEQGKYIGDFSSELKDPNQIECFWNITKQQIQKTLSTVPLPGRTLEGTIFINGNTID
jgi:hypothetical protein